MAYSGSSKKYRDLRGPTAHENAAALAILQWMPESYFADGLDSGDLPSVPWSR